MVTAEDFITFPCNDDLIRGGIDYARRSLAFTYNRVGGTSLMRLRRIVGGVAVELGLRRYLDALGVPYENTGATPFTEPDRYDIALGGRPCDVKSYLLLQRQKIAAVHRQPELLLQADALVPADQLFSERHTPQDIYLFAFMTALTARNRQDRQRIRRRGLPAFVLAPLPARWARPQVWQRLDPLYLKNEAKTPLRVEVGGQNDARAFICRQVELPPRTRVRLRPEFFSLAYVHASRVPEARLGLHAPSLGEPLLLQPKDWGNIWVYGMRIFLVGYLSWRRFRQLARPLPAGQTVFQYRRTRIKNYRLPVEKLRPIGELLQNSV